MTLQSLSKNPMILPGAAWLALPIVLVFALRRRGFFRVWGLVFGVTIAVDAWLNGPLSPIAEGSGWATASGVVFVILGDLRFFCAAEWDGTRGALARAFVLAWIVPVCSQLLRATVPAIAATPRLTYLAYEVLFLVVLALWYLLVLRRRSPARRALAARLARFFAVQYALWAIADIVLLTLPPPASDVGLALRLVPDMLYYVAFVPWVLVIAPASEPE